MFASCKHILRSSPPALVDVYPPQFQQVLRDIVAVRVPTAPVLQLRRSWIFTGMQTEFLHLLFKLGTKERDRHVRLAPVGIAATTHTILQTT
jgi:hypothetical protein